MAKASQRCWVCLCCKIASDSPARERWRCFNDNFGAFRSLITSIPWVLDVSTHTCLPRFCLLKTKVVIHENLNSKYKVVLSTGRIRILNFRLTILQRQICLPVTRPKMFKQQSQKSSPSPLAVGLCFLWFGILPRAF